MIEREELKSMVQEILKQIQEERIQKMKNMMKNN